jgi:hypothetical protein
MTKDEKKKIEIDEKKMQVKYKNAVLVLIKMSGSLN